LHPSEAGLRSERGVEQAEDLKRGEASGELNKDSVPMGVGHYFPRGGTTGKKEKNNISSGRRKKH